MALDLSDLDTFDFNDRPQAAKNKPKTGLDLFDDLDEFEPRKPYSRRGSVEARNKQAEPDILSKRAQRFQLGAQLDAELSPVMGRGEDLIAHQQRVEEAAATVRPDLPAGWNRQEFESFMDAERGGMGVTPGTGRTAEDAMVVGQNPGVVGAKFREGWRTTKAGAAADEYLRTGRITVGTTPGVGDVDYPVYLEGPAAEKYVRELASVTEDTALAEAFDKQVGAGARALTSTLSQPEQLLSIPGGIVGAMVGQPTLGAALGATPSVVKGYYSDLLANLQAGAPHDIASANALAGAGIDFATETLGGRFGASGGVLGAGARSAAEEASAELGRMGSDYAFSLADESFASKLPKTFGEGAERVGEAGIAGGLGAAIMVGAPRLPGKLGEGLAAAREMLARAGGVSDGRPDVAQPKANTAPSIDAPISIAPTSIDTVDTQITTGINTEEAKREGVNPAGVSKEREIPAKEDTLSDAPLSPVQETAPTPKMGAKEAVAVAMAESQDKAAKDPVYAEWANANRKERSEQIQARARELMEPVIGTGPVVSQNQSQTLPATPVAPPVSEAPVASQEAATSVPASTPVITFKTALGSTYQVNGQSTTRDKADHTKAGHDATDVGKKRPSDVTYYVPSEQAAVLSWAGASGPDGKPIRGRVVVGEDGKLYSATWNAKAGKWGMTAAGRAGVPFSTTPQVGYAPIELWDNKADVPGASNAYGSVHAGNKIVEIGPVVQTPVTSTQVPQGSNTKPKRTKTSAPKPLSDKDALAQAFTELQTRSLNDPEFQKQVTANPSLMRQMATQRASEIVAQSSAPKAPEAPATDAADVPTTTAPSSRLASVQNARAAMLVVGNAEVPASSEMRRVANELKTSPNVQDTKVVVVSAKDAATPGNPLHKQMEDGTNASKPGVYNANDDTIYIRDDVPAEVAVHETTHAATVKAIAAVEQGVVSDPDATLALDNLKAATTRLGELTEADLPGISPDILARIKYAGKNVQETVAILRSSPETAKALRDANITVDVKVDRKTKQPVKMNWFKAVVNNIADLLFRTKVFKQQHRDAVVRVVEKMLLADVAIDSSKKLERADVRAIKMADVAAGNATARQVGTGANKPVPKTDDVKAFHGSPHRFEKFKLSDDTIGTGEGAQAFGWGLYFASRRDLAEHYKNKLSRDGRPGKLYEVELAPTEEEYLDWDKPLSAQSVKVKKIAEGVLKQLDAEYLDDILDRLNADVGDLSGKEFYKIVARALMDDALVYNSGSRTERAVEAGEFERAASYTLLDDEGIPGIRYLEGRDRKKGEGAYNYVIFDDSLVDIQATYDAPSFIGTAPTASSPTPNNIQPDKVTELPVGTTEERTIERLRGWSTRLLAPKGLGSTNAKQMGERSVGTANAMRLEGDVLSAKLSQQMTQHIAKILGDQPARIQALYRYKIGEYLAGNTAVASDIPTDIRETVEAMREILDNNTMRMIALGAINADDIPKMLNNLGRWIHRDFEVFHHEPGEFKRITQERAKAGNDPLAPLLDQVMEEMKLPEPGVIAKIGEMAGKKSGKGMKDWKADATKTLRELKGQPEPKKPKNKRLAVIRDEAEKYLRDMAAKWGIGRNTPLEGPDGIIARLSTLSANGTEDLQKAAARWANSLLDPTSMPIDDAPYVPSVLAIDDSSIDKKRTQVPPWLQELWGKFKDPNAMFLTSLDNQANIIAKFTALQEYKQRGMANGTVLENKAGMTDANMHPKGFMLLGSKDDQIHYGPLQNMWIRREDYDYLGITASQRAAEKVIQDSFFKGYLGLLSLVGQPAKMMLIALNHTSLALQTLSSLFLHSRSSPKRLAAGLKAARYTALGGTRFGKDISDEQLKKDVNSMISQGLLVNNALAGDARRKLREFIISPGEQFLSVPQRAMKKIGRGYGKLLDSAGRLMSIGDEAAKVMMVYARMEDLQSIHPDKSRQELLELATEHAMQTMPVQMREAPLARMASNSGVIDVFATWYAAMARNTYNHLKIADEYSKMPSKEAKKYAFTEMSLLAVKAYGAYYLAKSFQLVGSGLTYALAAGDDEEEIKAQAEAGAKAQKEKYEGIRGIAPEHTVGDFAVLREVAPDVYRVASFQRYDPMPIGALMSAAERGDEEEKANILNSFLFSEAPLVKALTTAIGYFPEAAASGVQDVYGNVDARALDARQAFLKGMQEVIAGVAVPGSVTSIQRQLDDPVDATPLETFLTNMGATVSTVDVRRRTGEIGADYLATLNRIKSGASREASSKDTLFSDASVDFKGDLLAKAEAWRFARKKVQYVQSLGKSDLWIKDAIKSNPYASSLSKEEIISLLDGRFVVPNYNKWLKEQRETDLKDPKNSMRKEEVRAQYARYEQDLSKFYEGLQELLQKEGITKR